MSSIFWQERGLLIDAVRKFFFQHKYTEVQTPIMVDLPGTEVHLDYFATQSAAEKNKTKYLRSSPELHLKKLLSQGMHRIFEIAPCFRNGRDIGPWHNPEFTMLEYYQTSMEFQEFIGLTKSLLQSVCEAFGSKSAISPAWLNANWHTITVPEAFETFAKIKLIDNDSDLARKAIEAGVVSVQKKDDFETAYFKTLLERIEPQFEKLGGVVLYDYPPSQAALAKVNDGWAKRFEIYIKGIELCNGFEELAGVKENVERLRETEAKRHELGKTVPAATDEEIKSWSHLPQCCGNALGFERLLALLLNEKSIHRCLMSYVF